MMSQLIQALRAYADEFRIPPLLLDPEYTQNREYGQEHYRWLNAHLDEEARRHLKDYITMTGQAEAEYHSALFRSGLSLGLELAFLARFPE